VAQAKDDATEANAAKMILARSIGDTAIFARTGISPLSGGPWSYVSDIPGPDGPLIAPPPHYYALAGWGACTAVTVTGVAHRGNIPLEGLAIDFQLEAGEPEYGSPVFFFANGIALGHQRPIFVVNLILAMWLSF